MGRGGGRCLTLGWGQLRIYEKRLKNTDKGGIGRGVLVVMAPSTSESPIFKGGGYEYGIEGKRTS